MPLDADLAIVLTTRNRAAAIREAIGNGTLSEKRLESYQKLQREVTYAGLNARQLENEKLNRMFGGKSKMKQLKKRFKDKHNR